MLLWLWHRLAAVAPIGPLVQKLPYAVGAALKKKKKERKERKEMKINIGLKPAFAVSLRWSLLGHFLNHASAIAGW